MANIVERPGGYLTVEKAQQEAEWLVLVHGVSQDHRIFDKQVEAFADRYRLLLIDLPGHGVSRAIPGPFGLPEYAEHICRAIRSVEAKRPHFWGTHLGASAGLLLACRKLDLFRSLVLEAPVYPGRTLRTVAGLLKEVANRARHAGMTEARRHWWARGPWFDVMRRDPERCRAAEHQRIVEDFEGKPWLDAGLVTRPVGSIEPALAAMATPMLLLNGERDLADFLDVAEEIARRVPTALRCSVPNAGGFPLWECPDAVNAIVADFLDRNRQPAKPSA